MKVVAGASRTQLVGVEGEFLKIRVAAPAVEGRANQALVEFLSRLLTVPQTCIRIKSGVTSRRKIVQVMNCSPERMESLLYSTRKPHSSSGEP